jgi:hypothetical protein
VTERELRLLLTQNAVRKVQVFRTEDRKTYALAVNDLQVESTRRSARTWRSLETVARFLGTLGLDEFSVRLAPQMAEVALGDGLQARGEARKGIFDKLMERNLRGETVD